MPGAIPGRSSPLPGFGLSPGITIPSASVTKDVSVIRSSKFHLEQVHESYFQHLRAALRISGRLAGASAACALHALAPGLCTRTASRRIAELHATLSKRGDRFEKLRHAPACAEHHARPRHVEIEEA